MHDDDMTTEDRTNTAHPPRVKPVKREAALLAFAYSLGTQRAVP
jgi:hypothetical protein